MFSAVRTAEPGEAAAFTLHPKTGTGAGREGCTHTKELRDRHRGQGRKKDLCHLCAPWADLGFAEQS